MMRDEIEDAILELVGPGSMAPETIVDELEGEYEKREVKLAMLDLIDDDRLEEHPEFTDAYRLADG